MRKRILSILLACSMLLPTGLPVMAANQSTETTEAPKASRVISNAGESTDKEPIGIKTSYYDLEGVTNSPDITAESAMVMDATTGAILYSKQGNEIRYPASITKVMTALLTIENCEMDEIVTFSDTAVNGVEAGSSSAGINVGAKLSVEDVLYAMMLVSANEAGAALAEHVSGSVDEFAKLMTKRAKELGCTNTNFTNPHGLPDENHVTTAHDMALILRQAMKYDDFRKIAGTISHKIPKSDTLKDTIELWNHAKILRDSTEYYYEYAEGAKTGYTMAANNTLVTYAKKDGVELICVILKDYGADCSYNDTKALFKWAFNNVKGIKPMEGYDLLADIGSQEGLDEKKAKMIPEMELTYSKEYYTLVPTDFDTSRLNVKFVFDEDAEAGKLGDIKIFDGENVVGSTPVTYDPKSAAAVSYNTGEENPNVDDLQTENVGGIVITPMKIFGFFFRLVLCCVIVYAIMHFIHVYTDTSKRKQSYDRIVNGRRKHRTKGRKSSGSNNRSNTPRSGSNTSSSRSQGSTRRRRRHK